MIWYNLNKLENRLAEGRISESAELRYLLTILVFIATYSYIPEDLSYSNEWWNFSEFILNLAITLGAVKMAFSINRENGGVEFLKRLLSLSFVIGFRLLIWLSFLYLAFKIVMFVIPLDIYLFINRLLNPEITQLLLSVGITLLFYLLLIRSFKRVNREVAPVFETKGAADSL